MEWVRLGNLLHVVRPALRVVPHAPREGYAAASDRRRQRAGTVHPSRDLHRWHNDLFHVTEAKPRAFVFVRPKDLVLELLRLVREDDHRVQGQLLVRLLSVSTERVFLRRHDPLVTGFRQVLAHVWQV